MREREREREETLDKRPTILPHPWMESCHPRSRKKDVGGLSYPNTARVSPPK